MVRGRRTRAALANNNLSSTTSTTDNKTTNHTTKTTLLQKLNEDVDDEQNYASPKRKESKIENDKITKTKVGNQTKTSQRTIQKYFEPIQYTNYTRTEISANTKNHINSDHNYIEESNDSNDSLENDLTGNQKEILKKYPYDLTEEEDNETCDVNYNHVIDIQHNLFLQEPVLSLDIDKSPNQPSSIIINRTLEVEPIFSTTTIIENGVNLNGQFNKIVSLNGSPKRTSSSDVESGVGSSSSSSLLSVNKYFSVNIDCNSCDSGNLSDNRIDASPTKRRKPTTPHRILCPSPTKHPLVETCVVNKVDDLIMCKDEKHVEQKTPLTKAALKNYSTVDLVTPSQKRHSKSRRRLNSTQSENNSSMTTFKTYSPQIVGGVRLTNETLKKLIKNKNSLTQKSVLNSAKTPTAELNANKYLQLRNRVNNLEAQENGQITDEPIIDKMHFENVKNDQKNVNKKSGKPVSTLNCRQKVHLQNGTPSVKDFLPVRRSVRKTKTVVNEEMLKSLEKAVLDERDDGLKVKEFEGKGRGIIASRHFQKNEFVVEYIGDLINMTEANQRETRYSLDENAGCYMYYFKHKNQQYCIDATAESGKLGRLVNHSRNGNLVTKVVVIKSRPHLVLIAKDDIKPGEEITYDYGDRSKEALIHHPWLAL